MKISSVFSLLVAVVLLSDQASSNQTAPSLSVRQKRWVNSFDEELHYVCPVSESINSIISQHNNWYEDRVWDFTCKPTFSKRPSCYWTNYINCMDEQFSFTCPFGSVISGLQSYHNNRQEDRRWKFYCCAASEVYTKYCYWTHYVNNFDAYMHWQVPRDNYLVGISSYHDDYTEDRRFKFQYCAKS
ncbi:hemagglutinin/amebocyte aggregation factor-like isoform 1-T1 [Discoglossus pictus]